MGNVLITGSSSGFGYLTALALARRGERVFATMRRPEAADALRRAVQEEALPVTLHRLDVTDGRSVEAAVQEILREAPSIDVLINNAGASWRGPVETLSDEELLAQFDVNVFGVVRVIRAIAPVMRRQGRGTVVNVSSVAGVVPAPFEGAYSASKHALEALSEVLRFELAPFGVKVVVIEPGAYDTPFVGNTRMAAAFGPDHPLRSLYDRYFEGLHRVRGARRDPQEVVDAICEAVRDPDAGFRRLVGRDAEMIHAARHQQAFDEYERMMRAVLGL